ncbi:MFS transporter [Reinekea sp. G2M2-21]|uniref:MFS transporter n=1 Tax=Reinekea sp. G2M2-21 TaxID=2788942 RepID=UPI0018A96D58|nr:MFS transporter [Reinekea sp. G2M2-21]
MIRSLVPLTALLISDALMLLGHGLLLTLLPVTASNIGFSAVQIGLTGTGYFIGFVLGCLVTPFVLKRVGHIRSFAVLASLYTSVVLLFAWSQSFLGWMLLRFMIGIMIAGLYMIIESWLNERAESTKRGSILAFYSMLNLVMITLAQQLLNLGSVSSVQLFALAGTLLALSIVPVSVTLSLAPTPISKVTVDLAKVWRHSHIGLIGAAISGLVTGAFWALAPVYANDGGFNNLQLASFMSAAVLGGAIFQIPLGRLSDRYDRRIILIGIAVAGVAGSLAIFLVSFSAVYAGVMSTVSAFLWGAVAMTMYAICLAHANDGADSADFVDIGSAMLITYGVSSAVGAPLASLLMQVFSYHYFFIYMSAMFALFTGLLIMRRQAHVLPVVAEDHDTFQAVAGLTTPMAYNMDPRGDDMTEPTTEAEYEREYADVDVDYHEFIDTPNTETETETETETDSKTESKPEPKTDSDKPKQK